MIISQTLSHNDKTEALKLSNFSFRLSTMQLKFIEKNCCSERTQHYMTFYLLQIGISIRLRYAVE